MTELVHVDAIATDAGVAATPEEIAALVADGKCPECAGELIESYGLAGGGIGPYVMCSSDGCDFMKKHDTGAEGG